MQRRMRRLCLLGATLLSSAGAVYSFFGYAMACSLAPMRDDRLATTHVFVWVLTFVVLGAVGLLSGVAWVWSLFRRDS
jgi:hypothetical protein